MLHSYRVWLHITSAPLAWSGYQDVQAESVDDAARAAITRMHRHWPGHTADGAWTIDSVECTRLNSHPTIVCSR